ncbi:hypothetical protein EU244_030885 [Rhodococcus qingshengii]|uniref:hypothetical protein n=1 Tax=Rhodococcus qingshengii TaxID=334542 RepID=UPI0010A67DD9|nr:hypothetical protein [Rhodococcus qingshengii]THJ65703.1 hypothetical protein EU244_28845 [Rhodococcus qingshengii]
MLVGPGIESGNLRWRWMTLASAVGALAMIWFVSPVAVLVVGSVLGGVGLLVFHLLPPREAGARAASVGVGLLIPAVPLSVVHLVNLL